MSRNIDVIHDNPDAPAANKPMAADLPMLDDDQRQPADVLPADFPANAVPMGDGSYSLQLKYPVTLRFKDFAGEIKAEKYPTLHLKRLTGKDQREIRAAGEDDMRAQMIACSAGLTLGRARLLHDAMDAADISAAMAVVLFFIAPGRRTGQPS